MTIAENQKQAKEWARVLTEELCDNLHRRWAEKFADSLAGELREVLQEELSGPSAGAMAEELVAEMRERLEDELQEDFPAELRGHLQDDLEALVNQRLGKGEAPNDVWKAAAARQIELAEQWARWLACQLTSQLFEQLSSRAAAPVARGASGKRFGATRRVSEKKRPAPRKQHPSPSSQ